MRWRVALGAVGVLVAFFGVFRLLTQIPVANLVELAEWLAGAVILHDAVVGPIVAAVGWVTSRSLPPRARRYVQAAFVAGALVTVIAIPLIYRRGSQPRAKAILQQDYGANLATLLAVVAAVCLLGYALQVVVDHRRGRDDG